jgi:hypothetical protein
MQVWPWQRPRSGPDARCAGCLFEPLFQLRCSTCPRSPGEPQCTLLAMVRWTPFPRDAIPPWNNITQGPHRLRTGAIIAVLLAGSIVGAAVTRTMLSLIRKPAYHADFSTSRRLSSLLANDINRDIGNDTAAPCQPARSGNWVNLKPSESGIARSVVSLPEY